MNEKYKNPALTVDIAVFSIKESSLNLLLIKRKNPPFQDKWAFPGGFVDYDEEIPTAASRELEEETGLKNLSLEQAHIFGKPGRDPRGRTVSVVYYTFIDSEDQKIKANTDAKEVKWFSINQLPELAFDHAEIINFILEFIGKKLENTSIAGQVMPTEFTLDELQEVYEIILSKKLDSDRFKSEIKKTGLLEELKESKFRFRENLEFISRFY